MQQRFIAAILATIACTTMAMPVQPRANDTLWLSLSASLYELQRLLSDSDMALNLTNQTVSMTCTIKTRLLAADRTTVGTSKTKDMFETSHFVLCGEVGFLSWRPFSTRGVSIKLCWEVCSISECPLLKVSLYVCSYLFCKKNFIR